MSNACKWLVENNPLYKDSKIDFENCNNDVDLIIFESKKNLWRHTITDGSDKMTAKRSCFYMAMAVVSIIINKIKPISLWDTIDLGSIIIDGQELSSSIDSDENVVKNDCFMFNHHFDKKNKHVNTTILDKEIKKKYSEALILTETCTISIFKCNEKFYIYDLRRVLEFSDFNEFINKIKKYLEPTSSSSSITEFIEIISSRTDFKEDIYNNSNNNVNVIFASFNQSNRNEFSHYAGTQCVAMAATAIYKHSQLSMHFWDQKVMDSVLREGNKLYGIVLNGKSPRHLSTEKLNNVCALIFDSSIIIIDKYLISRNISQLDIEITKYFTHKAGINSGIFICQGYSYGIVKDLNYYFLFDSHSCNANGLHESSSDGKSCLVKTDFNGLCNLLKSRINMNPTENIGQYFTIGYIEFKTIYNNLGS